MTESFGGDSSRFISHKGSLQGHSDLFLGRTMSRKQLVGLLKKNSPAYLKEQLLSYPSTPAETLREVHEEVKEDEAKSSHCNLNDRWENEAIDEVQSVLEKTMSPKKKK